MKYIVERPKGSPSRSRPLDFLQKNIMHKGFQTVALKYHFKKWKKSPRVSMSAVSACVFRTGCRPCGNTCEILSIFEIFTCEILSICVVVKKNHILLLSVMISEEVLSAICKLVQNL